MIIDWPMEVLIQSLSLVLCKFVKGKSYLVVQTTGLQTRTSFNRNNCGCSTISREDMID
jgi:hypothetical protein